jgi:hypothetical protein
MLGDVSGDTGTYIWNLWVFRHELIDHHRLPFSTDHIFSDTGGADFSLHNYTPLAGLIAIPLTGALGLVGAFNVVMILLLAASGAAMFVLARRAGLGEFPAWMAGAIFIASPAITARETAHLSLINTAALPLFVVALLRTLDTGRMRDAALAGALVALATYSDAYYGVFCVLMGLLVLAWRFIQVQRRPVEVSSPRLAHSLTAIILVIGTAVAWRVLSGTQTLAIGPATIGLRTLYTPVLVLTVLVAWRLWLLWRPVWRLTASDGEFRQLARLGVVSVLVCLVLLAPPLIGVARAAAHERLPETSVHWRSSPRGVDALAYFVPNPNHARLRAQTQRWLMPEREDAFPEFVAAFPLAGFLLIAAGAWLGALPRFWVAFAGIFAALSLGPFVHFAGANTYVIGPWALLRYVPLIGMARSPSRFAIVAAMGLSLLCAFALVALLRRFPAHRPAILGLVAFVLAVEMIPAPRPLYSAAVPDVYRLLAADANDNGRLLELPGGIRDGTSSFGNFNGSTLYFQTAHQRPLIGGALSRVSSWHREESERTPMLRALFTLSEGRPIPPAWLSEARDSRTTFLQRSCVKFVLVNKRRATGELQASAVDALGLIPVHEDDGYALFTPRDMPACER